ncbi:MAG TPA: HAMP domain-containing sensor histidine kinase [Candidatus Krumholzibacteria bacterium]|nr:HAMP domain-containing sensor histidine kinase [Candidatus Krumholzibacteria bacterium]HRX51485.1 HAMP domain-containing sensor histidine kinase [Candidatus Krumholzibacteria bacterium]
MSAVFRSLHFRIAAAFFVLLALVFAGYTVWVDRTLYGPQWAEGEREWYDRHRDVEMDSLALLLRPVVDDPAGLAAVLEPYGRRIDGFEAEMAVVARDGRVAASTHPDTLAAVVRTVAPALLDSMSLESWDFTSYPDPADLDAYVNRITAVRPLRTGADAPSEGWLVATFRPLEVDLEMLESENRTRLLAGGAAVLLTSFAVGVLLLAFVSRRLRRLGRDMAGFREGDFSRRSDLGGQDEIARLGQGFNKLADRLSATIGELKAAEDYRTRLVANVSHDLRTPLATLRSYVESFLLRWEDLPTADRERQLQTITSNLDNLDGLVERLFELSQLDSGRAETRPEPFGLEELADDVIRRLEVKAQAAGVALELKVEGGATGVMADPVRVAQVLQNLVDNAVKFNRPGGRVTVTLGPAGARVPVSVQDDGAGIAAEDLPHVFERFYTADKSRTGKDRGSGLGLAIAHRIIQAHGGELTVESRSGQGACFRFDLPAAPDA